MPTIFQEPVTHKEQLFPDPIKVAAMRRGANWFYWIAGLSAVNSLIFALGGKVSFIIGLCYTQIVDAFSDAAVASGGPTFLRALAMVFNIAIVGFFALVGYYANRSFKTAFMIGIAVYSIDALLWLLYGGYLEIAFHIYALFFIIRGFLACRELSRTPMKTI